jgi:hypothetical protein
MATQGYAEWIPLQHKPGLAGSYKELPRDEDGAEIPAYCQQTFKQKYFGKAIEIYL